jgi:hypothetical protein
VALRRFLSAGPATFSLPLFLLILSFAGCSSENPVEPRGAMAPSSAPDLILDAANKAVPGGEVTGVVEEEEDGQLVYEVQKSVNGVNYEIEVTAEGEVLEIEEGDDDSWWKFWD